MPTSKKIRIIGTKQFLNPETNELEDFNVISQEEQDFNFDKLWIMQILLAIEEFGSQKMKLIMHLFSTRDRGNNTVLKTVRELSEDTGINKNTINKTLEILKRNKIIKRKIGVIIINPDVIFKGGHNKRMNVLIQYRTISQNQQEETKPKELNAGSSEINVSEIKGFALKNKKKAKTKIESARAGV
jgi:DNA-binding transcriptional regulator YhcF (GntR family)